MSVTHKEVGPNRFRESFGRYLEDFNVGDIYEHRPGRTITGTDNTWFTLLTMNTHPLHFDAEYAKHSDCLLYTSPSPRDRIASRMPSSA